MRVAQAGHQSGHGEVEVGFGQVGRASTQQDQCLHRVDRIGRPFRRQVCVGAAEHGDEGVEDLLALPTVETCGGSAVAQCVGAESLGQGPAALRRGGIAFRCWHADSHHE